MTDLHDALLGHYERWLMLTFYGDDSGSHGKGPFVVAGYLSDTTCWLDIEEKWKAALSESPRIAYFKGRESVRKNGQFSGEFSGFSDQQADDKRNLMAEVVRSAGPQLTEFSSLIRWDDYNSAIGSGTVRSVFYDPYFFALHGVISAIVAAADENPKAKPPIAFVFDRQSNLEHDSGKQYELSRALSPPAVSKWMGALIHEDDKALAPLQIADFIAWSIRATEDGISVPELAVLRERIDAKGRRWNPSGLAQRVADWEEKAARHLATPNEDESI